MYDFLYASLSMCDTTNKLTIDHYDIILK